MKKIVYLLLIFLIPTMADAQRWKRERVALFAGTGTSHFMGDLGGGAKDAAHFLGVRDMDWKYTRPTVQFGVKYRILEELAVKPVISYGYLKADDLESQNILRQARNLQFTSHIWEAGVQFEYSFIKEKELARYTFSSLRAAKKFSAYVIVGGGGLYFNPRAELVRGSKDWVKLRPLNNEGQGSEPYTIIEDGEAITITPDAPYGKFAGFVSAGLGGKYNLNRRWSIGLEITNRYTTTDYLDDAHDRYFENPNNPFSDRQLILEYANDNQTVTGVGGDAPDWQSGQPYRGDPEYNDAYISTVVTGYYKLKNTVRSMPKF